MEESHAPDAAAALPGEAVIVKSWHEPEIFAEIFHRHFDEIHRYVNRRLGSEAADEIAAETFLAAFRRRQRFDPERGAVRPWLYGIATNLIGSHRRAERRFFKALARVPADDVAPGHEERVAAQVSAGGVSGELAAALARLPSGDRTGAGQRHRPREAGGDERDAAGRLPADLDHHHGRRVGRLPAHRLIRTG